MPKTKAAFIEPMLVLRAEKLPQGADWSRGLKSSRRRPSATAKAGDPLRAGRKPEVIDSANRTTEGNSSAPTVSGRLACSRLLDPHMFSALVGVGKSPCHL